ncbi:MAG: hypothetical protein JRF71_13600, partial [Deltaproteobacteria bacterium]|nr:hypothetical protein [Deltaproteobacteria bacterium]
MGRFEIGSKYIYFLPRWYSYCFHFKVKPDNLIKLKNMDKNLTEKLLKRKNRLVSDFMENKASAFMDRHVRILDDYFHDNFETSTIGPRLGMAKNPYAVIAL